MALPIIVDTDIGNDPDDLIALAMVLDRMDLFDLRAVITTGKNTGLRALFVNHICKLSSREVPICVGISPELSKEPSKLHLKFFMESGADLSPSNTFPQAHDILREILTPEITIITIGPLSTLADLIITNPSMVENNVSQVISMGGFISQNNPKHVKEYNFGCDQKATRLVLSKGFQHICVTKNVCQGIMLYPKSVNSTQFSRSPARKFAFSFMNEWFKDRKMKILHDPFTLAFSLKPDKLKLKRVSFDINNNGGCKGTIIDSGNRFATIGKSPNNIDWFSNILYGEEEK